MREIFEDVLRASKEISSLIHTGWNANMSRYYGVGEGGDRSSGIDLEAEKIYAKHLLRHGSIYSEESGKMGEGAKVFILDPIDGSDNLLSSFPYYGSSVALREGGETVFSFIVNYASGDFFVKWPSFYKRGSLYHERLEDVVCNGQSRIGLFEKAYAYPDIVAKLKEEGLKFRSPGAVALSLGYARYVQFVIFKGRMRSFDLEAGLHQCQGLSVYKDGHSIIVAKRREVFDRLLQTIKG